MTGGMPGSLAGPRWRVRRTGGLLVPGFTKRMRADGTGTTYLAGIPVGAFRVVAAGDATELRYRRWPIVDVLTARDGDGGAWDGLGMVRLPGGRRGRFCTFRLERT